MQLTSPLPLAPSVPVVRAAALDGSRGFRAPRGAGPDTLDLGGAHATPTALSGADRVRVWSAIAMTAAVVVLNVWLGAG